MHCSSIRLLFLFNYINSNVFITISGTLLFTNFDTIFDNYLSDFVANDNTIFLKQLAYSLLSILSKIALWILSNYSING